MTKEIKNKMIGLWLLVNLLGVEANIARGYIYIYIYNRGSSYIDVALITITLFNIILIEINFEKFTIKSHFHFISSMLAKFHENHKSIIISFIAC